jgi:hypothetical protein
MLVNFPIYFLGRWLGSPTPQSAAFTMTEFFLGPIIFGLLAWGWRRRWSETKTNHAQSIRKESATPEVAAVFRQLDRILNDERAQLEGLPEPFRSEVLRGVDCDEIPAATGEFGRDYRNPIPVNGPLGEMVYLSNLRTLNSQPVMFHRLGSIGKLDFFELVSFDGVKWDILLLDLYHPRKSVRSPIGYRIASNTERGAFLFGTNKLVASFPNELPGAIADMTEQLFGGLRLRSPQVQMAIEQTRFQRPAVHQAVIARLVDRLRQRK